MLLLFARRVKVRAADVRVHHPDLHVVRVLLLSESHCWIPLCRHGKDPLSKFQRCCRDLFEFSRHYWVNRCTVCWATFHHITSGAFFCRASSLTSPSLKERHTGRHGAALSSRFHVQFPTLDAHTPPSIFQHAKWCATARVSKKPHKTLQGKCDGGLRMASARRV